MTRKLLRNNHCNTKHVIINLFLQNLKWVEKQIEFISIMIMIVIGAKIGTSVSVKSQTSKASNLEKAEN
jgi:hypothetical protein